MSLIKNDALIRNDKPVKAKSLDSNHDSSPNDTSTANIVSITNQSSDLNPASSTTNPSAENQPPITTQNPSTETSLSKNSSTTTPSISPSTPTNSPSSIQAIPPRCPPHTNNIENPPQNLQHLQPFRQDSRRHDILHKSMERSSGEETPFVDAEGDRIGEGEGFGYATCMVERNESGQECFWPEGSLVGMAREVVMAVGGILVGR
ncbi:MAG: hypothetical protein MMC33_008031 [Icmadophila ericetorum]|nr:hypothetical protein [Icmadophila ericetorum]